MTPTNCNGHQLCRTPTNSDRELRRTSIGRRPQRTQVRFRQTQADSDRTATDSDEPQLTPIGRHAAGLQPDSTNSERKIGLRQTPPDFEVLRTPIGLRRISIGLRWTLIGLRQTPILWMQTGLRRTSIALYRTPMNTDRTPTDFYRTVTEFATTTDADRTLKLLESNSKSNSKTNHVSWGPTDSDSWSRTPTTFRQITRRIFSESVRKSEFLHTCRTPNAEIQRSKYRNISGSQSYIEV
jgi:hypothetical protein